MKAGILAGVTWALETVILGIALSMSSFMETKEAVFLAPFVSTFLHDFCSALWAAIYNGIRGNLKNVWQAFKSEDGKWVVLAAIIGAPVGMTGYVLAVNYMGASIGAVASAIFPAIGTILAYIFLKEKMRWYQWIFLIFTLLGVYGLSYSPDLEIINFWIGFIGALMCSFGWGIEAVVLAKCLKNPVITDECALQIRQTTSAVVYGIILLPMLKGWNFTIGLLNFENVKLLMIIVVAALCATVSYLFYYRAIAQIGASKAMALNVTYAAWTIVFTVIIVKDTSVITPVTILCAVLVLVCGIFAAADFKEVLARKSK